MLFGKKFNLIFSFILLFAGFSHLAAAQEPVPEFKDQVVVVQFESGIVIREGAAKTNLSGFDRAAERYDVYRIERVFPSLDYVEPTPKTAKNLDALRRTYYVRYGAQTDPKQVSRDFSSESGVVYAEPVLVTRRYGPVPQAEEPNDPGYEQQPYLGLIHLPEAWDLVKAEDASEPIVIAIVDDGGDWDHEDLLANVWTNEDEIPGDGIDNDENGYIDDVYGVNLNNGDDTDNDPTPLEGNIHGTLVAGAASAVTDNGIGIAGTAWNAKLMHINVAYEDAYFGEFEGVIYAALNGADIINTSWGGPSGGEELRFNIQILDLVTDMGSLVVAAAGNDALNKDLNPSYPDGHPRVLSVGATERDSRQLAAEFSDYGKSVDIYAPGVDITMTAPNDEYESSLGTSFSAPLVSGIAALVKTRFPDLSPDELREQLRLSAENIDADNSLPQHVGQLNGGLVNAEASLQTVTDPAVRVHNWSWEDSDGNQQIDPGDEITVNVTFINYLAATEQLTVELVPLESYPYIILGAEQSIGVLETGDSTMVTFQFSVADDAAPNREVHFSVHIRDGSFTDAPDVLNFFRQTNVIDLIEALRALYQSTDGDNWTDNSGWDTTSTPTIEELIGGWIGVEFVGNQLAINLPQNNLMGMIPPELGQVVGLGHLALPGNQLSGPIPQELGHILELESLILGLNSLTGPIPSELGQLPRLQILALGLNALSGSIPPELGQLSELGILYLDNNQLTGPIPSELGQLSYLQELSLSDNQLTGTVPSELGQLLELTRLDLSNNALTGSLPRSLIQLDSLAYLSFAGQELCAPQDAEFQGWLQNVAEVIGETCTTVAIEETSKGESLPEKFAVHGNYPNPFQKTTHLTFDLPWQARVQVEVMDVIGRRVMSVSESNMTAGWSKSVELNGATLPAGLYLYRVIADSPIERSMQVGRFVRIR